MLYIEHCSLEKWLFIQSSQLSAIAPLWANQWNPVSLQFYVVPGVCESWLLLQLCDHYWLRDKTPFYLSSNDNVWCRVRGAILGFLPFLFHLTLFPHSLSIWKLNDAGIFSLWCKPSDLELLVSFLANPWHDGTPMEFPANPPTVELWNIILWSLSVHIGVYVLFYILSLLCLDW